VPLPEFERDDLPLGVNRATLRETLERFGTGTPRRKLMVLRLERICRLALGTDHVARLVVFGSFVTAKPQPNDVDVFVLMEDTFDLTQLVGEVQLLFTHAAAQAHFGASVFWLRRSAALGGEHAAIEDWQLKRDGGRRGVVEIILESP
jgi:predicted nucleotidyltransferase